jgi:transcription initiation factor TFIID TATA-box-binding protein
MTTPRITNISATFYLGKRVSLNFIGRNCWDVIWDPKKFNGLRMRLRYPKCTALIFASGKVVLVGCNQINDIELAACVITMKLKAIKLDTEVRDVKINNIAGTLDIKREIDLVRFAEDNSANTSYEKEIFPGLIYRHFGQKYSTTVFRTGKILVTGCINVQQLQQCIDFILPRIDLCNRPRQALHPSIAALFE